MSSSKGQEGSAVPTKQKGSWSSFLKSIASFNGDLASMTAPAFILSTTSLVEFSSYWTEHPSVFVAPAAEKDAAKRMLLVTKWFLSTLKQQYASRSEKLGSEKKPLNPFLGELFLGKWEDEAGETQLISEQVSHHPPVTAYSIWNSTHGVRLQGYNAQKASFKTTINVKQVGHAMYHIDGFNEDYLITLPPLHIEGLVIGSPYVELNSATYIQSSSGYTAKIEYSGRGWVSGKSNSFTAAIYPEDKKKEPIYTAEGQWTSKFHFKDPKTKQIVDTFDHTAIKPTPLNIAPVEQQDDFESRKAWKKVADAINKGDMDTTSAEKSIIENRQRAMRKTEKEQGNEWERKFFKRVESDPVFEKLAAKIGEQVSKDATNGVWNFDQEKASAAKSPFHPDVNPPIYIDTGDLSRTSTKGTTAA